MGLFAKEPDVDGFRLQKRNRNFGRLLQLLQHTTQQTAKKLNKLQHT
jgi:hypothetical protein